MTEKMTGNFYKRVLLAAVIIFTLMIAGCAGMEVSTGPDKSVSSGQQSGSDLKVHFIDVGQGDSTLIEKDGHFMLIDAGERDQGPTVVSYLKEQGVKKLDYVIGTHPHSDHIGGLEAVIKAFDVDKIIMPQKAHTTKLYERLLNTIDEKKLKITLPKIGEVYELGDSSFQILGPNRDYGDNLNNWSVGIRLDYGKTSFAFFGDAEKGAEDDMLANGFSLKADVLKVSHHGSSTSSSGPFLDQVSPEYAVISCGKDNDYGHPHKETMEALQKRNITVFRTDQLGSILAVSDGSKITFPGQNKGNANDTKTKTEESSSLTREYVLNTNTKKFHLPDCKLATSIKKENKETLEGTRDEVIKMGYEPCKSCKP